MGKHLCAFYGSIAASQTNLAIAPVQDRILTTIGTNALVVPERMQLRRQAALGAGLIDVRCSTASFRAISQPRLYPVCKASDWPDNPPIVQADDYSLTLIQADPLGYDVTTDGTAGPNATYVLAWLGDQLPAAPKGEAYTVRSACTASLSAGSWVTATPTLESALPAGKYAIVGMEAYGTGLIAARLIIPGQVYNPGVLCQQAAGQFNLGSQRFGRSGKYGEFVSTSTPNIEFLGATGTSQTVIWDLLKIG